MKNPPRFTMLRAPRPDTTAGRIYSFLKEEQGRWTANGIGGVLGFDPHKASRALQHLKARGYVRIVDVKNGQAGTQPAIYELIE